MNSSSMGTDDGKLQWSYEHGARSIMHFGTDAQQHSKSLSLNKLLSSIVSNKKNYAIIFCLYAPLIDLHLCKLRQTATESIIGDISNLILIKSRLIWSNYAHSTQIRHIGQIRQSTTESIMTNISMCRSI